MSKTRRRFPYFSIFRRIKALLLAAATLWVFSVTAGSPSVSAACAALRAAAPVAALRWELGDLRADDDLSVSTVLAVSQSPLLLSARSVVAEQWAAEAAPPPEDPSAPAPPSEERDEALTIPEDETPLDTPAAVDNGMPARTLVPTGTDDYTICGPVYISNSSGHALSPESLRQPFDAELTGDAPQVLILHTHGSEAYTPAGDAAPVWSGDYRTTDARYNVVRAGDVIADVLAEAGISVLHDRTLYDYPSYSGAYDRSLSAIESYLAQYPSIRFVLDVHRDAVEDAEGRQIRVVSPISGEQTSAQMTLVVGSDGSGLAHPRWLENLRLAVAVQEELLREHPTLMRPVLLRASRYNQHATTGSLLLEVGAAGNSPEEAALAAKLFAEGFVAVLEARSK